MNTTMQQKYGLTFSQLLSVITLGVAIISVWVRLEIAVARLDERVNNYESLIKESTIKNTLEHESILLKLDKVMIKPEYQK